MDAMLKGFGMAKSEGQIPQCHGTLTARQEFDGSLSLGTSSSWRTQVQTWTPKDITGM